MKINADEIRANIEQVRQLLQEEKDISPALRAAMKMQPLVVTILLNRVGLNSRNSSKPPSSDPNRDKSKSNKGGKRKNPGGQKGRQGRSLEPVADPDEVIVLKVDFENLPPGKYKPHG